MRLQLLITFSLVVPAAAQDSVRITEWMYKGNFAEFLELTNLGASPVDLAGWSLDDDSDTPGTVDLSDAKQKAYLSSSQHGNFVDCMKSRKPTINPIESAIRSDTISHLTNIAARTGRKVHFDPVKEVIVGDDEANGMLSRPMREGYEVA